MSRYRASLGIVAPRGLPDDAQSPRLRAEPGSRPSAATQATGPASFGPRGMAPRSRLGFC